MIKRKIWRIFKVENIAMLKEKFDRHEIDVSSLSIEEAIELEKLYREQILELDSQIDDINIQIEANKNSIRKYLDEMRKNIN